jgi:hypothetical protein
VATLASTSTTTTTTPTSTGPSFFTLLLGGLAIMLLGNLIGRFFSTRMHKTVSRKLYFFITIPIMVIFVVIVFVMGRSMTVLQQYVLFAAYILGFSILGGFVEAPPMPVRTNTPPAEEKPSDELPDKAGSDTVEGEGKDVTKDSPVDDKTEH